MRSGSSSGRSTFHGVSAEILAEHSSGRSPGFLLWHAALRWQREATAVLRAVDLTHVQFLILCSCWWLGEESDGWPSQRDIALHAAIDPAMTSQVVRGLEKAGRLRRDPDADDARVVRVRVTAAGRAAARSALEILGELDAQFFASSPPVDPLLDQLRVLAARPAAASASSKRCRQWSEQK